MSTRCIIAIDGPAGSGKSTVARALATRLRFAFLDTGAMYRAAAVAVLESGGDVADAVACAGIVKRHTISLDPDAFPPRILLDGRDVGIRIRDPDVSAASSPVSASPEVRAILVQAQRAFAIDHPLLVTEGRDQSSVVFPDAEVKVFLVARLEVRAARRAAELRSKGVPADEAEVLHAIQERDLRDSTRTTSPLREVSGSLRVDSSELSVEQVISLIEAHLPVGAARP
ncbi:MAG: (d)CMP kinase [Planctomycetota bacterium]|nr:(d)CMP kinase [Planctomycetota bacterium]MDA1104980.1 (d)CMP kinase [Planctomycetota bacterium]